MKKRILSLLLASSVMVSIAGCSSKESSKTDVSKTSQTAENTIDFKEAPYTLNVSYLVYGAAQPDLQKVFDKVNEITLKKINAKVELKVVSIANMANTYSLAASSGEKSDLISIIPGGSYLTQYAGSKMIKPFDAELDKWGKDLKAGMGDILEVGKYQGKQYSIPNKDIALSGTGFWLLKSIVDKYNIDVTKIKTLNDLDSIFEKVKAGEPNMQVYWPGSSYYLTNFDTLGNNYGVLKDGGTTDLKLVNPYETDEWLSMVKKMREWYLKGYIPKDYATAQIQASSQQNANKIFAINNAIGFDNLGLGENPPKVFVKFYHPVKKTNLMQTVLWAIPSNAQRPDKTIQFLNLAFQDKDLAKLTKFGIEGEHYDVMQDGTIDVNKGLKTYRQGFNYFGDTALYPVNKAALIGQGGDLAKYKTVLDQWNKDTKTSKAFGFIFDPTPVKTEIAALDAVVQQYGTLIEGGGIDPDKEIKNFTDKLNAAGLKKVMDEKQKQLDEWAKAKGVK
jgi:putative aldouronate transport system substrate-binding protein